MVSSVSYQLLQELCIPRSKIDVKEIDYVHQMTDPDFVSISPQRMIPVLHLPSGESITETPAIVLYILSQFDTDNKMHPTTSVLNFPKFLQGVVYASTEAFSPMASVFLMLSKFEPFNEEKFQAAKNKYRSKVVEHLVRELKNGQKYYYLGDNFSAVDICFSFILAMGHSYRKGFIDHPVVKEYFERLAGREHFKKLYGDALPDYSNFKALMDEVEKRMKKTYVEIRSIV